MTKTFFFAAPLLLMAEAIGAAPGEASPRLAESPIGMANMVDTAVGLLLVVGIMLALAWLTKRYMRIPGVGKGQVQILGGVSLGAREKAVLLAVEGRRLLVGVAPGRVQTLMELSDMRSMPDDFASQLEAASADNNPVESEGAA